jgi:RNA polymerase sigma factor for flagellar operon FliA
MPVLVANTTATPDATVVERLVTENLPLVGYLVNELVVRLPGHVSRDDLSSAGMTALLQAARAYDPERGVPFNRYASTRIRGAMLDELRAQDWAGRSVRQKARERDNAAAQLEATLGRPATRDELAEYMGVDPSALDSTEHDVHRSVVLSLQGFGDVDVVEAVIPAQRESPEDVILKREQVGYLHSAVAALPEKLRTVIAGYFFEGRTTAEIAAELRVGESRISQLRSEALLLLRDGMNSQLAPEMLPEETRPGGCVARRRASYFAAVATAGDFRSRIVALPEEVEAPARPRLLNIA